jgi:hypothetical protein
MVIVLFVHASCCEICSCSVRSLITLEMKTQLVAFVQQAIVHGIGEDAASSMLT